MSRLLAKYGRISLRYYLLVGGVLAGVALLVAVLYAFAPRARSREVLTPAEAKKAATQLAKEGEPLVQAIYKFRNEWGLWPISLDELPAPVLDKKAMPGWKYNWTGKGWKLRHLQGFPDWAAYYVHQGEEVGWKIGDGGDDEANLNVPVVKPKSEILPKETQIKKCETLFEKRVKAFPQQIIHYEGFATFFLKEGELESARKACVKCREKWPEHWWPNAVLAQIEAKMGRFDAAEKEFVAYTKKRKDFPHAFLLARFYAEAGKKQEAFKVLKEGCSLPIVDFDLPYKDTGENLVPGAKQVAWCGAWLCYELGNYDLGIEICDRWEKTAAEHFQKAAPRFSLLRAGCYLAKGDAVTAAQHVDKAKSHQHSFGDNSDIEAVSSAVKAKNAAYVYKPRVQVEISLAVDYE